jgi:hypothetical protein
MIETDDLQRYEHFTARFEPVRRDDLKLSAAEWIGYEGEWEAAWLITEDDGGDYVGEWACTLSSKFILDKRDQGEDVPLLGWVPERDLVRL